MVWHSHLFNNFPKFIVMHTAIGFSVVNETEVDVSLESVFIPIPKKGDAIEYLNYRTIVFNLHTSKVVWYSHIFKNFPQFLLIYTVKGFGIINKTKVDVFLEFSCFFFYDPTDVGCFISSSSAFSKSSLNIWKFSVHVLLKPDLEEMATRSSTLAWKIPWTKESGRLQSMGSQRVGHD